MREMSKPIVAIVGRPNVGKSTLFNRLVGKPTAIVAKLPGTTRDRIFADVSDQDTDFTLVDSGGLELRPTSSIAQKVRDQVDVAIGEADMIVFLADVRDGVIPADLEIADILRRCGKPVVLAVNKADSNKQQLQVPEFYQLGLGDPIAISAYHGKGISEFLDKLIACLTPTAPPSVEPEMMKVAIVGRPNVGKSLLLNTILKMERVIVSDIPGTTHDAIDTVFHYNGQPMLLIDTGGIRRRGHIGTGVERYSMIRALRAITRADVALLVTDATEAVTAQDLHIAGYIKQAFKGMELVVNKWDLVQGGDKAQWTQQIQQRLKFMSYVPILYTSAKLEQGVDQVLLVAREVYQERQKCLSTSLVNSVLEKIVAAHKPSRKGTRRLKIFDATQSQTDPPTFVFRVNDAKLLHFSYQRYLENELRQSFGFRGTPLRLIFKSRGGR